TPGEVVQEVAARYSLNEKQKILKDLLNAVPVTEIDQFQFLEIASEAYENGHEEEGDLFTYLYLSENELDEEEKSQEQKRIIQKLLLSYSVITNFEDVKKAHLSLLFQLKKVTWDIWEALHEMKLGTFSSIKRKIDKGLYFGFSSGKFQRLEKAALIYNNALDDLKNFLNKNQNPEILKAFVFQKKMLLLFSNHFFDAFMLNRDTVVERAKDIQFLVDHFKKHKRLIRLGSKFQDRQSELFRKEKKEAVRSVWLSRESILTAVTIATIGAAEIGCVIATGGICLTTAPKWVAAGRAITSLILATQSATNIIDRYRFQGGDGLMSMATLIDVALIFAVAPRPTLKMLGISLGTKIGPAWLQKFTHAIKPFKILANTQHLMTQALLFGGAGYGTWQMFNADKIVQDLEREGIQTNASAVRKQAAGVIGLSLLGGFLGMAKFKESLATNRYATIKNYKSSLIKVMSKKVLHRYRYLNILSAAKGTLVNLAHVFQSTGFKQRASYLFKALGAGAVLGYDVIAYSAFAFLSFSYGDVLFEKKATPLPELKDGEIALIFNGFAQEDLLHHIMDDDAAKVSELRKYKKGVNLFEVDLKSPMMLFKAIEEFGKVHGKVKYLKIMAHGLPGKFFASGTGPEGEGGAEINEKFILQHKDYIQEVARKYMAPDAVVRLYSCLVGANLDKDMDYLPSSAESEDDTVHFSKDSGDRIINAIGNNLLVNGGTIDSSRRVIIAIEKMLSPAVQHAMLNLAKDSEFRKAISDTEFNIDEFIAAKHAAEEERKQKQSEKPKEKKEKPKGKQVPKEFEPIDDDEVSVLDIGLKSFDTMVTIYSRIWTITNSFGMNVEGHWFKPRHRTDYFEPQTL
ncbi:MAG: hypothetical protein ACPGJV_14900, partial [Bacteriovoracaceae bacterium]